jgi:hypothetical protein
VPSKHLFRPPEDLIDKWPEVFEDTYINTLPVAYLEKIIIEFSDGKVWDIDVPFNLSNKKEEELAQVLHATVLEHQETIKKINFSLDIDKLKKDIINNSKKLL